LLCSPGYRPSRHAFPTRRSSDLIPRRPSPTRVRGARRAVSRCFSSFVFDACLALERKIERKSSHNPSRSRKLVTTGSAAAVEIRSEEHTSELQSRFDLVCRLLLE